MAGTKDNSVFGKIEETAQLMAERNRVDTQKLLEHFGKRPWAGEKLTQAEQMEAFDAVREDRQFWDDAFQKASNTLKLTPGRIPREVVMEGIRYEQRRRRNGPQPAPKTTETPY